MKVIHVTALGLLLAGCTTSTPPTQSLTADRASAVAQHLANEKAQALYNCQPFAGGLPARFVDGRWVWHDIRGHSQFDLEATVELGADGSVRTVDVILLDGRARDQGYRVR